MMNSIEEHQNLVELLKQALLFYGNENNYPKMKTITGNDSNTIGNNSSQIEIDRGSQARFALGKIDEVNNNNQKILDDYVNLSEKMIGSAEDNISTSDLDVQELIKTIGELNGEDNNI